MTYFLEPLISTEYSGNTSEPEILVKNQNIWSKVLQTIYQAHSSSYH